MLANGFFSLCQFVASSVPEIVTLHSFYYYLFRFGLDKRSASTVKRFEFLTKLVTPNIFVSSTTIYGLLPFKRVTILADMILCSMVALSFNGLLFLAKNGS